MGEKKRLEGSQVLNTIFSLVVADKAPCAVSKKNLCCCSSMQGPIIIRIIFTISILNWAFELMVIKGKLGRIEGYLLELYSKVL